LDTDNLKAITTASSEPVLNPAEQPGPARSKTNNLKMKGAAGLAASALLATSLLLSACGEDDDCIRTTPPPAATVAANGNVGSFGTPAAASLNLPTTPASTQFTTGQPTAAANQVYCRSRRTGGYYWFTGTRYYSGGGGSSSSSSS
jgi:hypothetical protein